MYRTLWCCLIYLKCRCPHTLTSFCSSSGMVREALNHSARAGSERFFPSRRFRKRRNPVCISRFLNRTDGGKDPLPSRRRIVQRFLGFHYHSLRRVHLIKHLWGTCSIADAPSVLFSWRPGTDSNRRPPA